MAPSGALAIDLILAVACAAAWTGTLVAAVALARPAPPRWLPGWTPAAAGAAAALAGAGRAAVAFAADPAFLGDRALGAAAFTLPGCAAGLAALMLPARRSAAGLRWRLTGLAGALALTTAALASAVTLGTPTGWLPLVVLAVLAALGMLAAGVGFVRGRRHRALVPIGVLAAAVLAGSLSVAWMDSRGAAPASFPATPQPGVAAQPGHHGSSPLPNAAAGRRVDSLRGAPSTGPLREFTLHARSGRTTLDDGRSLDALTFGSLPGPELRAVQGDTVRVHLVNDSVPDGVTLHWHGYDVPNAMDGVPGVTQDAVMPGHSFTYEFPALQTGTYWYHTHQNAAVNEPLGLYGALIVDPPGQGPAGPADITVPVHTIGGATLFGAHAGLWAQTVEGGTQVRLRLINTDQVTRRFSVAGAPFRVAAIDGAELPGGAELTGTTLPLAAGGRYDVVLTVPDRPVAVAVSGSRGGGLALVPPGDHAPSSATAFVDGPELDLATYGAPAQGTIARADAAVTYTVDHLLRFVDGVPRFAYTVNGAVYPNIPALVVSEGEKVLVTIANRSDDVHPMHPHGHHVRVVSIDGRPVQADLRMDSLEVRPGHVWTMLLTADNPGIWMDHCHNLDHARDGMVFHLAYTGVETPFRHGAGSANRPE